MGILLFLWLFIYKATILKGLFFGLDALKVALKKFIFLFLLYFIGFIIINIKYLFLGQSVVLYSLIHYLYFICFLHALYVYPY